MSGRLNPQSWLRLSLLIETYNRPWRADSGLKIGIYAKMCTCGSKEGALGHKLDSLSSACLERQRNRRWCKMLKFQCLVGTHTNNGKVTLTGSARFGGQSKCFFVPQKEAFCGSVAHFCINAENRAGRL